jgi:hypothetical protein
MPLLDAKLTVSSLGLPVMIGVAGNDFCLVASSVSLRSGARIRLDQLRGPCHSCTRNRSITS